MAQAQRVSLGDGTTTWTVIGADHLPVKPVDEYFQFLADSGRSPNTIRAYATGLAAWWTLIEHTDRRWDAFPSKTFGDFLNYVRTGDMPDTTRIGQAPARLQPGSVQVRAAAVLAFYRFHASAHHLTGPYEVLYTAHAKAGRSRYKDFLTGIADRGRGHDRPLYRVRSGPKGRTPVLEPLQVRTILDRCATQAADGSWSPSLAGLRDRFLFALLAETGLRIGEAMSLLHNDIHAGTGDTPWIEVVPRQNHPHVRCKSDQPRRVYIGHDLEALYSEYVWALVDRGIDVRYPNLDQHFVFVNVDAGTPWAPMRPESVYQRVRLTRAAKGVPAAWSPHWLRHTHATALLLAGRPPHVVMRRLGHLDVQTTLTHYGWVTEDAEMRSLADWKSYIAGWGVGR